VYLPDGMDWLLRPVIRDKIRYESLLDGKLDLCDIALINEAIDVYDENALRARKAVNDGNR